MGYMKHNQQKGRRHAEENPAPADTAKVKDKGKKKGGKK